ncbi:PAS domain S-box protein [Candidatus Poribacteria bacterium]|nr:PAS domain S-box protein [Candidatus Poribacteria bacterium]
MLVTNQLQDVLAIKKESIAAAFCLIDDGVIITDKEGRIVLINEVAEMLVGWSAEDASGKFLGDIVHIVDEKTRLRHLKLLNRSFGKRKLNKGTTSAILISRDGKEQVVDYKGTSVYDKEGNILGFVLILKDITEKRKIENTSRDAQEPGNLHSLSREIAHDFNNKMTVLMGNISLAKMQSNHGDEVYKKLTEAERASLQMKKLTHQLFSRINSC